MAARQQAKANAIEYRKGSAEALPLNDHTIDFATMGAGEEAFKAPCAIPPVPLAPESDRWSATKSRTSARLKDS